MHVRIKEQFIISRCYIGMLIIVEDKKIENFMYAEYFSKSFKTNKLVNILILQNEFYHFTLEIQDLRSIEINWKIMNLRCKQSSSYFIGIII
jgi:hypothetical protein